MRSYGGLESEADRLGEGYQTALEDKTRRPALASRTIIGLGLLAVAVTASLGGSDRSNQTAELLAHTDAEVSTYQMTLTNEYGQLDGPQSLDLYKWDFIAEPHRVTWLRIRDAPAQVRFNWTIGLSVNGSLENSTQMQTRGSTAGGYEFRLAGALYIVRIERADGRGKPVENVVACKYVRREIRQLNEEDKGRFFAAAKKIYFTREAQGRSLYGSKFRSMAYFTKKHAGFLTVEGCTPWHTDYGFLTAHSAFTLEFEQALQAIDPRVSAPYWEISLDATLYGDQWAQLSPMFQVDTFGIYPPSNRSSQSITSAESSHFGNLPLPTCNSTSDDGGIDDGGTESSCVEHNPYDLSIDAFAFAKERHVARSSSLCGVPTTAKLPTCRELEYVLDAKNGSDFRTRAEGWYHGASHGLIGGVWGCDSPHLDPLLQAHPGITGAVVNFLSVYNTVGRDLLNFQGNSFGPPVGNYSCPQSCSRQDESADFDCTCVLPQVRSEIERTGSVSYETAVEVWESFGLAGDADQDGTPAAADFNATVYELRSDNFTLSMLSGLTVADAKAFVRWCAIFVSRLPAIGSMTAVGGSTADPSFWPLHGGFQRLWHFSRLRARAERPSAYASAWASWGPTLGDESSMCEWARDAHSTVPWRDLTHDHGAKFLAEGGTNASDNDDFVAPSYAGDFYTNEQLLSLFEPNSDHLPFVFDVFDWSHCARWDSDSRGFHAPPGTTNGDSEPLSEEDMPLQARRRHHYAQYWLRRLADRYSGVRQGQGNPTTTATLDPQAALSGRRAMFREAAGVR